MYLYYLIHFSSASRQVTEEISQVENTSYMNMYLGTPPPLRVRRSPPRPPNFNVGRLLRARHLRNLGVSNAPPGADSLNNQLANIDIGGAGGTQNQILHAAIHLRNFFRHQQEYVKPYENL